MRRKLLQFSSLIAQHALRGVPKPRPQPQPHHHRFLHSPSAPTSASPSPSPSANLLWNRLSGATGVSLLPRTAQPHHHRFLHSPSAPTSASPSPSPSANLLWNRLSGATGVSLLPRTAADAAAVARTAASRCLAAARGAGSLDLFSLQRRRRASWWQFSSSTFLQGAPWAYWMESPESALWMLIGANVAVFMLWRVADPEFMKRHFMISLDNFKSGRLHTLLTNAFSHIESSHLCSNMIGLFFFGNSIANQFGPAFLFKLYVAGALTGSVFFLLEKAFRAHRKQDYEGWDNSRVPALGASAAVNATILLQIFLYPKGLVYLYFVIPVPAALMGAGLIAADLLRLKRRGEVSGSAHLGGALVAALVWARLRMF